MIDDKIVPLGIKAKTPPTGELMLVEPPFGGCIHWNTTFVVDVKAGEIRCSGCNSVVSPFFVLERLMRDESRWNETRRSYQDEMRRLEERSATKCQHCHKMTRISHR